MLFRSAFSEIQELCAALGRKCSHSHCIRCLIAFVFFLGFVAIRVCRSSICSRFPPAATRSLAFRVFRKCSEVSEFATSCGVATIPENHFSDLKVYESSPSEHRLVPGGTGIPNADIVIYITISDSGKCGPGSTTAAFASRCRKDQNDRPVAGNYNLCAGYARDNATASNKKENISLTIHEISHVLGFQYHQMPYFRYKSGEPRTERTEDGEYALMFLPELPRTTVAG